MNGFGIKQLIGILATGGILLPSLILQIKIMKIKNNMRFIFIFFLINTIFLSISAVVMYFQFSMINDSLLGAAIVYIFYALSVFLMLIIRNYKKRKNSIIDDEEGMEDFGLDSDSIRINRQDVKEFNSKRKNKKSDFSNDEDEEVKKLLNELYKEMTDEQ